MYKLNDTIVALATVPGRSALNVIKVSGGKTLDIFLQIVGNKSPLPLSNYSKLYNFYSKKSHNIIDQGMVVVFRSPKSFTGENMMELSTHGGIIIANSIIGELVLLGARLALPGEFSYRAFINEKIDLVQAEALSALIDSNNPVSSYLNLNVLVGAFSKKISALRMGLFDLIVSAEHLIDFNEQEIVLNKEIKQLQGGLIKLINNIKATAAGGYNISQLNNPSRIAIVGYPNVGKSSLFNKILGYDRSIIASKAGTTRDTIEATININGNIFTLIDTAGIRQGAESVEAIGIKKTFNEITKASIVLVVDDENPKKIKTKLSKQFTKKTWILVFNKLDLKNRAPSFKEIHKISCKENIGLDDLLTMLSTVVGDTVDDIYKKYSFSINLRQQELLKKILKELTLLSVPNENIVDFAVFVHSLYSVLESFDEIIQPNSKNEIINTIFKGFCVGK